MKFLVESFKTWNIEAMTGYKPMTTYYDDFSIAEPCFLLFLTGSDQRSLHPFFAVIPHHRDDTAGSPA